MTKNLVYKAGTLTPAPLAISTILLQFGSICHCKSQTLAIVCSVGIMEAAFFTATDTQLIKKANNLFPLPVRPHESLIQRCQHLQKDAVTAFRLSPDSHSESMHMPQGKSVTSRFLNPKASFVKILSVKINPKIVLH